jgi:hypothetical protein
VRHYIGNDKLILGVENDIGRVTNRRFRSGVDPCYEASYVGLYNKVRRGRNEEEEEKIENASFTCLGI